VARRENPLYVFIWRSLGPIYPLSQPSTTNDLKAQPHRISSHGPESLLPTARTSPRHQHSLCNTQRLFPYKLIILLRKRRARNRAMALPWSQRETNILRRARSRLQNPIQYFERNGVVSCPPEANPTEYMMETTGCAPGTEGKIDWPKVWRSIPEFGKVHQELEYMERTLQKTEIDVSSNHLEYRELAARFIVQLWECLRRVNSQYWRSQFIFTRRLGYVSFRYVLCVFKVNSLRYLLILKTKGTVPWLFFLQGK
jgi:hypothetical protein